MKLTFAGTRGYIGARTRRHRMHAALEVFYYDARVRIDWGEDWKERGGDLKASAILITHAHPDHAGGLAGGAPCPVYATEEAWETLGEYPVAERRVVIPDSPFEIEGITFEAMPVLHSVRAPAVGYRVTAGRAAVFYAPDLVYIQDRGRALKGVRIYIGDGATLTRSFVRKQGDHLIGHVPVRTQLTWCRKEGVPRAVVTHCGSEIVEGDERRLGAELRAMARERGVAAEFARDGQEIVLR